MFSSELKLEVDEGPEGQLKAFQLSDRITQITPINKIKWIKGVLKVYRVFLKYSQIFTGK